MNMIEVLQVEHGVLRRMMDLIEDHAVKNPRANPPTEVCRMALDLLASHARMEDELLFTALEPHVGAYGPLILVDHRNDHREIAACFQAAARMGEGSVEKSLEAARFTRAHFDKEEKVLFTLARRALGKDELEELAVKAAKHR
jgi:hemerythrin-like domain-containing protein